MSDLPTAYSPIVIDRHERAHIARMEVQRAPCVRVTGQYHPATHGVRSGPKRGDRVDLEDNHVARRAAAFLLQESPRRRLVSDRANEFDELITDREDVVLQSEVSHPGILVPRREPEGGVQLVDHLGTVESGHGYLAQSHRAHEEVSPSLWNIGARRSRNDATPSAKSGSPRLRIVAS